MLQKCNSGKNPDNIYKILYNSWYYYASVGHMAGGKEPRKPRPQTHQDTRFTLENNPGLGVRASARLPNHPQKGPPEYPKIIRVSYCGRV